MSKIPSLTLNDGGKIPQLGAGTAHNTLEGIQMSLKTGYRHLDTAHNYKVQHLVGQAIKKLDIPRKQLFITSKVWKTHLTREKAIISLNQTLKDLDTQYVDLLLIHWPYVDGINPKDGEALKKARIQVWKTFIEFKNQGKVKHIGVSNFLPKHIQQLIEATGQKPVINQIINHPFKILQDVIDYCKKQDILIQAWSPFARQRHNLLINPDLKSIALKYKRTVAEVILRWITQNGIITIPKSDSRQELQQNLTIFDFDLTEEDMRRINEMHIGQQDVDQFNLKDMYVE